MDSTDLDRRRVIDRSSSWPSALERGTGHDRARAGRCPSSPSSAGRRRQVDAGQPLPGPPRRRRAGRPRVTRDRISYEALWNGKRFTVVDTGGWDPKATGLGAAITRQAQYAMETADVIVFVVDSPVGATDTDLAAARILRRSDRPVILVANKVDDERSEANAAELWSLGHGGAAAGQRAARPLQR